MTTGTVKPRFILPPLRLGRLYIHPSAAFLPALIYFFSAGYFVLLVGIAVLVHELGHYITLRLCGGRVECVKLWLGGVSMVIGELGYTAEAVTALAGPAASMLLAVAAAMFGRVFSYAPAYQLSGLSLLFALFNMLPVFPLDGGRVLFAVTARLFGLIPAERLRLICAVVLTATAVAAGLTVLLRSGSPTLFIAAVALAVCASNRGEA